ncbi:MAG TPA: choice-of-anchor Q domain-containing protein [Pyrinomonadaceae bacterium]|nr:choice-of-anchor Q domain-containing protein [Pyrinomonadaceae bacterium]
MKRKVAWSLLTLAILVGASLKFARSVSSNSSDRRASVSRAVFAASNLNPLSATTFDVDTTSDNAADTACTVAPGDCSLRGAIIAANADAGSDPVIINLQPGTTYNLTLANATQENAAATGDLDITTTAHTVTIAGGGSSGPGATVIDAAGLNTGGSHDRAFQITGSGVTVIFQDLIIRNGEAADDGTSGASTNPSSQNATRSGGGILNDGGSVTLDNVVVQSCRALGKGDTVISDHTTLDAQGGGVASLGATGSVSITGSTFTGDSAQGGDGGNFNNGAGSAAKGGSIYFEGGTLDIEGSRIDNSTASGGHGGNVSQDGQTNGGFGGTAQGGGVWIGGGGGTATINNTTFENTVANGGDSGTGGNGAEPAGEADGGGLYSLGNTTVTNSTFHLAGANGGNGGNAFGSTCLGAHNAGDGGAARGGAILADGGTLVVDTSTFANDSAVGGNGGDGGQTNGGCGSHGAGGLAYGGAITNGNAATVNIKHATVSLNNAQAGNTGVNQGGANKPPKPAAEGAGGGIRVGPAGVAVENTIIAGNTAANGAGDTSGTPTLGPDVDGAVTSNGHNLLGNATDATGFNGAGDQTGANPMLASLADNGGPTPTMALSPGSPAIDAGVAAGATFDQRGQPRTVDDPGVPNVGGSDGTDIGAYEAPPSCNISCPSDFSVANDTDECGAVVTYTVDSSAACGTVTCDHPSGSFFPVGDTNVTCTSSAGPACSFKVTVNDTQNPKISAPPDASYECAGQVPPASPSQATASDNCGAPNVAVAESNNGGAGSVASPLIITRTYTATDASSHTASAVQTITVSDDMPPSVTPPANITVDADAGSCSAVVNPGTATGSDNCGGTVSVVGTRGDSQPLSAPYPVGTTTITWTATDSHGNSWTAPQTVTVKDTQPPTVTNVTATPNSLWPPNHSMQSVAVTYNASDNCGGVNCVISSVASNEPVNGTGDGDTAPDWVIVDPHHVQLRAERAGGGSGRTYMITIACTDSSGNTTTKTVAVNVPKSQGK